MGVPVLYQGSKYAPVPFVPIPPDVTPPAGAPQFVSAEIGAVSGFTLNVTFDQNVSASNYATGITIKVNGTSTSITSADRWPADHAKVEYIIPVLWHGSGDSVTWENNAAVGNIVAEAGGAALGDVSAQAVTNNCEYAALLDLQADTLALSDGDPVSTWADQSGNGYDFTASGSARPTYRISGGISHVEFDGIDDWMIGQNWAALDNLPSVAIFIALGRIAENGVVIGKILDFDSAGWMMFSNGLDLYIQDTLDVDQLELKAANSIAPFAGADPEIALAVIALTSLSTGSAKINALDVPTTASLSGTLTDYSNNQIVALGTLADGGESMGFLSARVRGIMICAPVPSSSNLSALASSAMTIFNIPAPVSASFVSAEIGAVDASTVAVSFSHTVTKYNAGGAFGAGITIKVNGVIATIDSTTDGPTGDIVYYLLTAPVASGDSVTWEYNSATGATYTTNGVPLESITVRTVTNNVV